MQMGLAGFTADLNPVIRFESETSAFGKVVVEAHGVPPEPENGFPGAWVLDAVRYVDVPETFEYGDKRYARGDDVLSLLDYYESEELKLQALEEWEGSQESDALAYEENA